MRHGRVAGHEQRRFLGRTEAPLDNHGRAQCVWWRDKLPPLAEVWCSPLGRARESAALASDCPAETKDALREINLGDWDGLPMDRVRAAQPAAFAERGRRLDTFRPPGGESFADLAERAYPVLRAAADYLEHPGAGNLLLMAHGGVNRTLLCLALGVPLANLLRLGQNYACLNRLFRKNGQWLLASLNQTPPENLP